MNTGTDSSGSVGHDEDRSFLRSLRGQTLAQLRGLLVHLLHSWAPEWQEIAVSREIERRARR